MSDLKTGKIDLIDKLGNQQQHGKDRDDRQAGIAVARDGQGSSSGGKVIGCVTERLRACSSSTGEQRRRNWFMARYLSVRSRGGSAENAPNGMKRTMGGAKGKGTPQRRDQQ